jgi:CBS-domain-containing membrane protein
MLIKIKKILGFVAGSTGHAEKLISASGGFIGILLIIWVSGHYLGLQGAAMLVASMGASAVLLFAVPGGALSQPWPLLGGHLVSALIGVTCAQAVENTLIAAPLAVGLAIAAMYYLRCIHPPGGATALTAVLGGEQLHALGYQYLLTPVLLNALVILVAAVLVNYAFPWRRYPAGLRSAPAGVPKTEVHNQLSHADFKYALTEIGAYVDISEDDLSKIYRLAVKHAWQLSDFSEQISTGLYYSNGKLGDDLSVRRVQALSCDEVTYQIVAGEQAGIVQSATLADFSHWQQYEVILKDAAWRRIRQVVFEGMV